jgi:hypothetical protein
MPRTGPSRKQDGGWRLGLLVVYNVVGRARPPEQKGWRHTHTHGSRGLGRARVKLSCDLLDLDCSIRFSIGGGGYM